MLQKAEEREVILTIQDHSIAVGQQSPSRLGRTAVQLAMPVLQQMHLQQTVGERHEDRLVDDQAPGRRVKPRQVPKAFDLAVPLLNIRAEGIEVSNLRGAGPFRLSPMAA